VSGDTGAANSIAVQSLLPSALREDEWLGHRTNVTRVLVVDVENPDRLVRARFQALGVTNDVRDRLRYFGREGIALGDDGRSDAWLRGELASFAPDLVVIATLMAACDLEDTNSNAEAVRMMKGLRALAREYGWAVLLLHHHERKRSKDQPSSSGQAMMGARQWAGQADVHMTLTVESTS
jgi:RecA-family ATPase